MTIDRRRYIHTDGTEEEFISVSSRLDNPEATEQLGRNLLQAAVEWRREIETRGPPGVPAYKIFEFASCYGGNRKVVASWIEHPWALVRLGKGTAIAFLVKEEQVFAGRRYRGWIVSAKIENGRHHWKCRFEGTSTVETRDLIQIFRYALPDSPTLGDIESAREKARALAEGVQ
jgi:hypothetical protein